MARGLCEFEKDFGIEALPVIDVHEFPLRSRLRNEASAINMQSDAPALWSVH